MKKLTQISEELRLKVNQVKEDGELTDLGFTCEGLLCENEGYENFFERLWVWAKAENNEIYIVVTADSGNGYCSIVYTDMYVKEVINKLEL